MASRAHQDLSVGGLNRKSLVALGLFVLMVSALAFLTRANVPVPAAAVLTAFVVVTIAWLLSSARVSVTDDHLIVGGGFYRTKVPWADVLVDQAEELPIDSPFKLRWRTNGLGWPGLSLGWFTTNRSRRVFAAVSGKERRLYIPLKRDFDIVVTPSDPGLLLAAMRDRHVGMQSFGG